jgi:hypothetical protein
LRITASRSPRSSAVKVILCMPSKMEHTQPISMLQWTSKARGGFVLIAVTANGVERAA